MANLKIDELKNNAEDSKEVVDLRSEMETFTAFKTLRGGLKQTCWACWAPH